MRCCVCCQAPHAVDRALFGREIWGAGGAFASISWRREYVRGGFAPSANDLAWFYMGFRQLACPGAFSKREKLKRCLRSLKEGTETSCRRTDDLGSRLERPIHFECKLNEPLHIGMRLLHPAAADHSVSIIRQQVQRIFRFSLRSRAGARPLSGGTEAVATGTPSGNEGYIRNQDVPYQSVTLDVTSEDRRFGIPTKRPRILPLPVSRGSQ